MAEIMTSVISGTTKKILLSYSMSITIFDQNQSTINLAGGIHFE